MKILVYGAGVLGCNLARNLFHAGKDVTLLARGNWAEEIRKNGLRIKDQFSLSSSTNTRLFNDYNGTESCNPPKTHKTPPQNCLQRGSLIRLNSRKARFQAVFGHRKNPP